MQRFVTGCTLESTHEVANAHAVLTGYILESEFVRIVFFEPLLDLKNGDVLMQLLTAEANNTGCVATLDLI